MTRRLATLLCGALAVSGVVLAGSGGAQADDGDAARTMLSRSRQAVSDNEFEGTVLIEWLDGGRRHERSVPVEVSDGVLRMGDDQLVSAGSRRLARTDDGWQLLWTGSAAGAEPDPTDKYRFDVNEDATVAKRPATQVSVRRSGASVRERLFFDDASGMLLRRDQLDASGRIVRRFAFVKMTDPQPIGTSEADALPKPAQSSKGAVPHALDDVPDDLPAPKEIGNGFVLTGVYSQPDGSVQLYYSDGLLGLSVFERSGEPAWDSLPEGGRSVEVAGKRARVYRTAAGVAVVWGHDEVTFTYVSDAPIGEIAAAAARFARSGDTGLLEDVGRFITAPFSWG